MLIPVISLHGPWANWCALGWKEIETRLHNRFRSLEGRRIGIHQSCTWDTNALEAASPYLDWGKLQQTETFRRTAGAVIGIAAVTRFRDLTEEDSSRALIDCGAVKRTGLILAYPKAIEAIPCRGGRGIFYMDIPLDKYGVDGSYTDVRSHA